LPFATTPSAIRLHKLAHADGSAADPSESNRAAENIVIHSSEIPTHLVALDATGNPKEW
jgi:hypothetical protein